MITWEEHVEDRLAGGVAEAEGPGLLTRLLAEQQRLTAVERFAQKHERDELPVQSRYYHDLIPLSEPEPGEQYAFEVDLDTCTSCKACVTACHSLNGLREEETWRSVGVLVSGDFYQPERRTVTTACHHCLDPACANGCPVLAYEKDPVTGVVRHLDDQCIGCQYCILKCPYEVPQYSKELGIVRKCDMCHSRLAEGEAPACVQACPNEAITIRIIRHTEIQAAAAPGKALVPGAVDSHYTQPSTVYRGSEKLRGSFAPADSSRLHPEHTHLPLVLMLTLTQAGLGLIIADAALRFTNLSGGVAHLSVAIVGALLCFAGLAASILHLGRPLQAWRAFLGWRKSWLSREILAFGPWSGLVAGSTAMLSLSAFPVLEPLLKALPGPVLEQLPLLTQGSAAAAMGLGLAAVFCSVMVYVDTRRAFWSLPATLGRFFGNSLALAAWGVLAVLVSARHELALAGLLTFGAVLLGKLAVEFQTVRHAAEPGWSARKKSALLQLGPLRALVLARLGLAGLALVLALGGVLSFAPILLVVAGLALLAGEFCERAIYFKAVVAHKMPGDIFVN